MSKKLTAKEAIAAAKARSRLSDLTPAALKELRELCEHNDAQITKLNRVAAGVAIEILRGHGWNGASPAALNKICREQLGRASYASAK